MQQLEQFGKFTLQPLYKQSGIYGFKPQSSLNPKLYDSGEGLQGKLRLSIRVVVGFRASPMSDKRLLVTPVPKNRTHTIIM